MKPNPRRPRGSAAGVGRAGLTMAADADLSEIWDETPAANREVPLIKVIGLYLPGS